VPSVIRLRTLGGLETKHEEFGKDIDGRQHTDIVEEMTRLRERGKKRREESKRKMVEKPSVRTTS
jgi:hypothetical protein